MDPTLSGLLVAIVAAALSGLGSSLLTTYRLQAVMDQKVSDVTRRVVMLEDEKVDTVVHQEVTARLMLADAVNKEDISRERHRMNNWEQRHP